MVTLTHKKQDYKITKPKHLKILRLIHQNNGSCPTGTQYRCGDCPFYPPVGIFEVHPDCNERNTMLRMEFGAVIRDTKPKKPTRPKTRSDKDGAYIKSKVLLEIITLMKSEVPLNITNATAMLEHYLPKE